MHVHLYVLLKIIIKEKNMNQVALGRDELMHSAHVYLRVLEKKEANTLLCRVCMHTC